MASVRSEGLLKKVLYWRYKHCISYKSRGSGSLNLDGRYASSLAITITRWNRSFKMYRPSNYFLSYEKLKTKFSLGNSKFGVRKGSAFRWYIWSQLNITCNTNTNGKYRSESPSFISFVSTIGIGIIWRPSSAAMKYVYKTSVTTYDWMFNLLNVKVSSLKKSIDLPECKQVERKRYRNQQWRLIFAWTHTIPTKSFARCSQMLSIPVFVLCSRYSPPTPMASRIWTSKFVCPFSRKSIFH